MKRIKFVVIFFLALMLTSCDYNVENILLVDKNENVKNFIGVWNDYDYGNYSLDIKNQLEFFFNMDDYNLNPHINALELELKNKKPINYFKYIKKDVNNGVTTLKIKIPPLVSYTIYDGSYQGTSLSLQISLAKEFEFIEANTFDIETYKSSFDNLEYTKIVWIIPTNNLAKGTELILKYKVKK